MKIDNSVKTSGGITGTGRARTGVANAERKSEAASPPQVDLSPMSARLNEIESGLASMPVMNSERVAEIRQAIAQGSFKIDSSKIADSLIDSVRQMLKVPR